MDPGSKQSGDSSPRVRVRATGEARYEVLGEVARGGMGRVLRVRDRRLGRELAMKVLDPGAADGRLFARFLEEARLTSQLDHPSIVGVYDAGELEDGRVFYTMPLVDGRTLDEVLELTRRGAEGWSRTRVLHALLKACEALAYAHDRGVVHRDLKPSNLMVGRHGEVLVLDWGLARRGGRAVPPSGTPATMAPEVLSGAAPAGRRADVYAFGAILYALCTGRLPYADEKEGGIDRILRGPPTPIATLEPTIPADLVAIAEKAMARAPGSRYPTMSKLQTDLERFLDGRVVAAHPVGAVARAKRWARRHPRFAASLVAVFVLLLALVLERSDKLHSLARAHGETLRRAYAANLSAAEASLRTYEIAEAKRRLSDCDAALRGWEWRYLWRKSDSAALVLRCVEEGAPPVDVDAVAASPDGARIATGSADVVTLWSAATGEELARTHLGSAVLRLAYAYDGAWIAAGLADGGLVHLAPGDLAVRSRRAAFDTAIFDLAAAPDEHATASCAVYKSTVRLEREGFEPLEAAIDSPTCLAFLGAGVLAVGLSDPEVVLLDARDLSELRRFPATPARVLAPRPAGAAPSNGLAGEEGGATVLAIGDVNGGVALLDLASGELGPEIAAHAGPVTGLAWDADGARLASAANDKTLALWDARSGALLARRYGHVGRIEALTRLPEGRGLVTGSADGTARVWHDAGGAELVLGDNLDWVEDVAFGARGAWIASVDWSAVVRIRRASDGALLRAVALPDKSSALAFAPDGRRLACAVAPGVLILDAESGEVVDSLPLAAGHALGLAWIPAEPGGTRLVAHTSSLELVVLAPGAPARVLARDVDGLNGALAVAPERNLVATGTQDGRVLTFDLASGDPREVWEVHAHPVSALAFDAAEERLCCGSSDGAAAVLDAHTGAVLARLDGHDDRVTDVAFAPDGERVFTASKDGTVRVWDGADLLLTLRGHAAWVAALDVSADGDVLASASQDGTVRLWRAPWDLPGLPGPPTAQDVR
jgi:WD40 repeat protein